MHTLIEELHFLHAAFCKVTGADMPLNQTFERWWYDAINFGITVDMVTDVMTARMKRQYQTATMRSQMLKLRYLIGDCDKLADCVEESAQLAAMRRKKVFVPDKASVLKQTSRESEPEPMPARTAGDVIKALREAAL